MVKDELYARLGKALMIAREVPLLDEMRNEVALYQRRIADKACKGGYRTTCRAQEAIYQEVVDAIEAIEEADGD